VRLLANRKEQILAQAPIEKGPTRNLTHSSGAHDKWPSWSPDGSRIAFATAVNQISSTVPARLWVRRLGSLVAEPIAGSETGYQPFWSPDGRFLAFGSYDSSLKRVEPSVGSVVTLADGAQLGVRTLPDALTIARESGLDLVEVAANADPPVCKIMDFGKYKYEQDQRRKESRKRASNVVIKEMKFRPKIDSHDYDTKMKHVERFLEEGSKVKLTIMFRGREMAHPELGRRILEKVAERVAEIAIVESAPKQDGRNMVMVLNPIRKPKVKGSGSHGEAPHPEPQSETQAASA